MSQSTATGKFVYRARFNPLIRPYLVFYVAMFLVLPVVTIPLENIKDVTFIEGPLLRWFQLSALQFRNQIRLSVRGLLAA